MQRTLCGRRRFRLRAVLIAVLLESGEVFFMGRNVNFELGFGHSQSVAFSGLRPVKTLLTKACSVSDFPSTHYSTVDRRAFENNPPRILAAQRATLPIQKLRCM